MKFKLEDNVTSVSIDGQEFLADESGHVDIPEAVFVLFDRGAHFPGVGVADEVEQKEKDEEVDDDENDEKSQTVDTDTQEQKEEQKVNDFVELVVEKKRTGRPAKNK